MVEYSPKILASEEKATASFVVSANIVRLGLSRQEPSEAERISLNDSWGRSGC